VEKNELLGSAAALLMAVEFDEPFGIVMAEALACGTPIIGFPRGSIREVIRDGVTGFLVRDCDEAASAVGKLERLSRNTVRTDCEARFSAGTIVRAYEGMYRRMRNA
jgi:glycosyltransferase involved in cell wall biosynthesis